MNITFDKEFEFEGSKIDCLNLDLDNLTGQHLIDAVAEAHAMFYYHLKCHNSKTNGSLCVIPRMFYYHLKCHDSKTIQ